MSDVASRPASPGLPRWAAAADYAAALLLLAALTIACSGGFRTHVGHRLLIMTSPLRLALWAAIAVGVRHALVPRPTIVRHLAAALAAACRSTSLRSAAIVVGVTRPLVFLTGYLAVLLFGYIPGAPLFHYFNNELLSLPLRWDAGWYLQIATEGYSVISHTDAAVQQNFVFFPAFPMLVRVLGLLGGDTMASFVVGATAASVVLFLLALTYLYELAREDLSEDQSAAALWLLAAFPFAFFFGAIYTESLYLLGAVGAFYHFRRGQLVRAAAWGLIVGLTRPNGFFLCVPLAIMAFERRPAPHGATPPAHGGTARALAAAAMPAVGVLLYSLFVARLIGNPLAWAAGHAAWGRHYSGLATLVASKYEVISSVGVAGFITEQPYEFLNALGVIFVLASVWPVARRFGYAYAAFIVVNMLPPLADGGLMSAGRLSAVLFPAFLWLAAAVPARHRAGWITVFAALQAFNAALFYTWRPLY